MLKIGIPCLWISSVFTKSRGGQGLGGRHFTQGGRPTVVIAIGGTFRGKFSSLEGAWGRLRRPQAGKAPGGTFRRDFLSLEGALRRPPTTFSCKTFAIWGRRTIARGVWPSVPPAYAPALNQVSFSEFHDIFKSCQVSDLCCHSRVSLRRLNTSRRLNALRTRCQESLTRAPLGGGQNLPLSWIFSITPKPLQISTQNLVYLILHHDI